MSKNESNISQIQPEQSKLSKKQKKKIKNGQAHKKEDGEKEGCSQTILRENSPERGYAALIIWSVIKGFSWLMLLSISIVFLGFLMGWQNFDWRYYSNCMTGLKLQVLALPFIGLILLVVLFYLGRKLLLQFQITKKTTAAEELHLHYLQMVRYSSFAQHTLQQLLMCLSCKLIKKKEPSVAKVKPSEAVDKLFKQQHEELMKLASINRKVCFKNDTIVVEKLDTCALVLLLEKINYFPTSFYKQKKICCNDQEHEKRSNSCEDCNSHECKKCDDEKDKSYFPYNIWCNHNSKKCLNKEIKNCNLNKNACCKICQLCWYCFLAKHPAANMDDFIEKVAKKDMEICLKQELRIAISILSKFRNIVSHLTHKECLEMEKGTYNNEKEHLSDKNWEWLDKTYRYAIEVVLLYLRNAQCIKKSELADKIKSLLTISACKNINDLRRQHGDEIERYLEVMKVKMYVEETNSVVKDTNSVVKDTNSAVKEMGSDIQKINSEVQKLKAALTPFKIKIKFSTDLKNLHNHIPHFDEAFKKAVKDLKIGCKILETVIEKGNVETLIFNLQPESVEFEETMLDLDFLTLCFAYWLGQEYLPVCSKEDVQVDVPNPREEKAVGMFLDRASVLIGPFWHPFACYSGVEQAVVDAIDQEEEVMQDKILKIFDNMRESAAQLDWSIIEDILICLKKTNVIRQLQEKRDKIQKKFGKLSFFNTNFVSSKLTQPQQQAEKLDINQNDFKVVSIFLHKVASEICEFWDRFGLNAGFATKVKVIKADKGRAKKQAYRLLSEMKAELDALTWSTIKEILVEMKKKTVITSLEKEIGELEKRHGPQPFFNTDSLVELNPITSIVPLFKTTPFIKCQGIPACNNHMPSIRDFYEVVSNNNEKKASPTQQLIFMLKQMEIFLNDFYIRFTFEEPSIRPVFYLIYFIYKRNTFHKILAQTSYIVGPAVPDNLVQVKEKCEVIMKSSSTLQHTYHFNQLPTFWEEPSTNSSVKHKLSHATEDKVEKVLSFFNNVFIEAPNYIKSADNIPPNSELESVIKEVVNELEILQRCVR